MVDQRDEELVRRCQRGDREAFGELAARYQKRLFNLAYRFLGDYEDARGTVQEAFILAYRAIKSFRREAGFYTWLCRILIRLCYRKIRRKRRVYSLQEPIPTEEGRMERSIAAPGATPRQVLIDKETREVVQEAINSLKDEHRFLILLRDFEGLSYREMGEALKCPPGTVRSRLHRARQLLKKKLKKYGTF